MEDIRTIEKREIIIVVSADCAESVVMLNNPREDFGVKCRIFKTNNYEKLESALAVIASSYKISRVDISGRDEKYFQTYDTGESTAICVRHAKYDGKTHLEVVPDMQKQLILER